MLYTRAGCHLCDEMKRTIESAHARVPYTLDERDVDADPELRAAYDRSIPVLTIGGRVAFKGRLTRADFERKLERIARELAAGGSA